MKETHNPINDPNTLEEAQQEPCATQEEEKQLAQEDYEKKYQELHENYIRVYADFENTKKRLEREKFQALEYAYEKIAKDLLPVVDTLEKALESSQSTHSIEAILEGLKLTIDNLLKVLSKHGIECIDCDQDFDPNFHDAIMQVPSEEKSDGEIVQVLQKGYKYKERMLRPAMVSIAKNN
ncbi:nucleotide exchange factor GrpE [Helicobacter sp. 12S02634-8]|uniref:nucleotide exchange factor GrpE n=1 Tax=Helicobacter sp. 12S02634-8 TaxID=1476199 RepID=UPI000BA50D2A|nr:nucleotide exchange factor GrpE [Helicobacter sp. 12S02634-8]PAF46853.1 nucleotide exchange factor GrpE [Helicobacter sp. 12S02634-8]